MITSEALDALFEKPCFVLDFLPAAAPVEGGAWYFALEKRLGRGKRRRMLRQRFARVLVNLGCYYRLQISTDPDKGWTASEPQILERKILRCGEKGSVYILCEKENALWVLRGGDCYMTLYDPTPELLKLARRVAEGEGLFLREGVQN